MLLVDDLHAYYGKSHVLQGVSLEVAEGETIALVGRNGAGKSTTLKSIMSLVETRDGTVQYQGQNLIGLEPYEIARLGISYVPENRGVFTKLTVEQNLAIATRPTSPWSLDRIYALFPRLEERRQNWGFQLSGGEQQMLAIARALLPGPRLILLDEPSQGLAPVVLRDVVQILEEVRAAGIAVLLVEQNLDLCARLAERFYVLDSGQIVYRGSREEFVAAADIQARYLTLDVRSFRTREGVPSARRADGGGSRGGR